MQLDSDFKNSILEGIPNKIPESKTFDNNINRAPLRKKILNSEEKEISTQKCFKIFS